MAIQFFYEAVLFHEGSCRCSLKWTGTGGAQNQEKGKEFIEPFAAGHDEEVDLDVLRFFYRNKNQEIPFWYVVAECLSLK